MVATRSMRKRTTSKRQSYRRLLRKSPCRGKGRATCRRTSGCKYSSGKKRSFCRKSKNTTHKMKGGSDGSAHYNKQHAVDKHASPLA